jgi:hypothetical protein
MDSLRLSLAEELTPDVVWVEGVRFNRDFGKTLSLQKFLTAVEIWRPTR